MHKHKNAYYTARIKMKKILLASFFLMFLTNTCSAIPEEEALHQLVTFMWDGETQQLKFNGTGSGVFVNGSVITNKHVVTSGDTTVDFVLLCQAKTRRKSSQTITCDIPAAVTAIHPSLDVALVKPLSDHKNPFITVPFPLVQNRIGDRVRLFGFPSTTNKLDGFGGDAIFKAFSEWNKTGGIIETKGSNITITRGEITDYEFERGTTRRVYYATNAKGNFGMSGGAAFNKNGKYIGIPTLINNNNDTYLLALILIKDWIYSNFSNTPEVQKEILDFYIQKLKKGEVHKSILSISPKYIAKKKDPLWDTNKLSNEGKAAKYLYDKEIISGRPDGSFDGSATVNRAELSKFLLLAKKIDTENTANIKNAFPDVEEGAWYQKYVVKANQLGIISGYPDGKFKPAKTVNTAEFLKMFSKTFDLSESLEYEYTDVSINDWFSKYAGVAQKYKLFPQRNNQSLEPARELTRNEVAVAIWRVLNFNEIVTSVVEKISYLETITFDSDKDPIGLLKEAGKYMPMVDIIQEEGCKYDSEQTAKYTTTLPMGVYWKCPFKVVFNNPSVVFAVDLNNGYVTRPFRDNKPETTHPTRFTGSSGANLIGYNGDIKVGNIWFEKHPSGGVDKLEFSFLVSRVDENDNVVTFAPTTPETAEAYEKRKKYESSPMGISKSLAIEKYGNPISIEKANPVEYWIYADDSKLLFNGGTLHMWDLR